MYINNISIKHHMVRGYIVVGYGYVVCINNEMDEKMKKLNIDKDYLKDHNLEIYNPGHIGDDSFIVYKANTSFEVGGWGNSTYAPKLNEEEKFDMQLQLSLIASQLGIEDEICLVAYGVWD